MKHKLPAYLFLLFSAISLLTGCSVFDKPEPVPAFLRIDSISVQIDSALQGSSSHRITEAWVYIDDKLQGIYEVPCNVPILELGEHELKIRGGIRRNGQRQSRTDYPFYNTYATRVNFKALETIEVNPVVGYFNDARVWFESFEDLGVKLYKSQTSDTNLVVTNLPSEVFEGKGAGKLPIRVGQTRARVMTAEQFPLPYGNPVFVELNYLTQDTLIVGLVSHQAGFDEFDPHIFLLPNAEWNKIYIDLSELRNEQSAATLDIYFELWSPYANKNAHALIDNIKLVYPE